MDEEVLVPAAEVQAGTLHGPHTAVQQPTLTADCIKESMQPGKPKLQLCQRPCFDPSPCAKPSVSLLRTGPKRWLPELWSAFMLSPPSARPRAPFRCTWEARAGRWLPTYDCLLSSQCTSLKHCRSRWQ